MSGRPRYAMASGRLPFRQAIFPAVICKGKRKKIEIKRKTDFEHPNRETKDDRGLSLSLSTLILSFLGRNYR